MGYENRVTVTGFVLLILVVDGMFRVWRSVSGVFKGDEGPAMKMAAGFLAIAIAVLLALAAKTVLEAFDLAGRYLAHLDEEESREDEFRQQARQQHKEQP